MILVDTDVLIDSLKDETYATDFIQNNDLDIHITRFTFGSIGSKKNDNSILIFIEGFTK